MDKSDYNPALQAIISIRHLALGLSNNWNQMNKIGDDLNQIKSTADSIVNQHADASTLSEWELESGKFDKNVSALKEIMDKAVAQIKNKKSDNLSDSWGKSNEFATNILENFNELQLIGTQCLSKDKKGEWVNLWQAANDKYIDINNISEACGLQLKMIEEYKPDEIDEMTNTILKHIPLDFSLNEADKYEKEYLHAYEELKKEASQNKNIWDKFLDLLAGGTQQTPAQRVMMQRWVDGEKDDIH